MPRGKYKRTPEQNAKMRAAVSAAMKKHYENPENRAKQSAALKKMHREHPEIAKKTSDRMVRHFSDPKNREAHSQTMLKYFAEHPEVGIQMGLSRSGSRNPGWQGGVKDDPRPKDDTVELRDRIRARDGHQCQICGKTQKEGEKKLPVHHIDYDKMNSSELNLITLCNSCHSKTGFNREYWQERLSRLLH